MNKTFSLLLINLCSIALYAQQSPTYSHTTKNGVQIYSTNTNNISHAQQKQQSNEHKQICYYSLEEVENTLMYCDSKLSIAREMNNEDDVFRYEGLKKELLLRKEELTKQH